MTEPEAAGGHLSTPTTPEARRETAWPIKTWEDVHDDTWRRVGAVRERLIDLGVPTDVELIFNDEDSSEGPITVTAWETPVRYGAGTTGNVHIGEDGLVYVASAPESEEVPRAEVRLVPEEFRIANRYPRLNLATYLLTQRMRQAEREALEHDPMGTDV